MNIITKLYVEVPGQFPDTPPILVDTHTIDQLIKDIDQSDNLPGLAHITKQLLLQIKSDLTSNDL